MKKCSSEMHQFELADPELVVLYYILYNTCQLQGPLLDKNNSL